MACPLVIKVTIVQTDVSNHVVALIIL